MAATFSPCLLYSCDIALWESEGRGRLLARPLVQLKSTNTLGEYGVCVCVCVCVYIYIYIWKGEGIAVLALAEMFVCFLV